MSGKMKKFKDLLVDTPNRYTVNGEVKTIVFSPNTITQEGTKDKAEYFNEMQKNGLYNVNATRVVEGTVEFYDIAIEGSDIFDVFDTQFIINFNETNTKLNPVLRFNNNNYYIRMIESFIDVDVKIGSLQKTYIGFLDSANNKLKLMNYERKLTFDTVADMQTATWLVEGDTVQLLGYYTKNDGAGNYRKVELSDNGSGIDLGNGLFANLIGKTARLVECGAKQDGTDCSSILQKLIDNDFRIKDYGTYKINIPVILKNYSLLYGTNGKDSLYFQTDNDIEMFASDPKKNIYGAKFENVYIKKLVTGATAKYDIRLYNPCLCEILHCTIQSSHDDTNYSETNRGGIYFQRSVPSLPAYMNRINNNLIKNNSVVFEGITDSSITENFLWGHTRQFTVALLGSQTGAIEVSNNLGIIPSRYKGGIWVNGAGINQLRICNNEFDGNPSLMLGKGIFLETLTYNTIITGNTIWHCGMEAVHAIDPVSLICSNNNFWKNNGQDNFYSDILLEGSTFNPQWNIFNGNTHLCDDLRNNKGYIYEEKFTNGTNIPLNNLLTNSTVDPQNYNSNLIKPAKKGVGQLKTMGNSFDTPKYIKEISGTINPNGGYIDLDLGDDGYNYTGFIIFSLVRSNYRGQSRSATHFLSIRDGVGSNSMIGTWIDGSGGGITYTITILTGNIIRLTNTSTDSGVVAEVKLNFDGIII